MYTTAKVLTSLGVLLLSGFGCAQDYGESGCGSESCGNGIVACYYGMWSIYKQGVARYGLDDIPTDICTQVIYSFAGPKPDGTIHLLDEELTSGGKTNKLEDFQRLKEKNPDIKLLVGLGGWSEASANFSLIMNNATLRDTFIENLHQFAIDYKLDGLDMDWEYPAQRGGVPSDKEAFAEFVKLLKEKVGDLLVTIAVGPTQSYIDSSYDVAKISQYADQIHLITYDLHGPWETTTGVIAPLFDQLTDPKGQENLSVSNSVQTWIKNGAAPNKIVVGIPNYGKSFTLASQNNTSTGAPATGAGPAGKYTQEAGTLAYYEICEDQKVNPTQWDITEVSGNYVYANKDLLWVGYDNANTAYAKGKYAKENGLGGVMYWSIDLDDFSGICGPKYPIVSAGRDGYCSS